MKALNYPAYNVYWWPEGVADQHPPICRKCLNSGWFVMVRKSDGACSCCTGHQTTEEVPYGPFPGMVVMIEALMKLWGDELHPDIMAYYKTHKGVVGPNSEWVGEEKVRQEFLLVYVGKDGPFEGDYGESWKYKFLHAGKDVVVWFTKACEWLDRASDGAEFRVKATPTSQNEFKGIKETKFSRMKQLTEEDD